LADEPEPPAKILVRKFASHDEVRQELETNLVLGSLWIPLDGQGDPEGIRPGMPVELMLTLADGRVLDSIRGRVFCRGPGGVAIYVDQLPPVALTVLREEAIGLEYVPPESADLDRLAPTRVGAPQLPAESPSEPRRPEITRRSEMNPLFRSPRGKTPIVQPKGPGQKP